jgi:hypothetical protein
MMNQADIFKKIGIILNELQEQYEFLAQNPEQLNELELELFLANANFLSDHVEIIRKLNTSKVPKELPQHTEISSAQAEQIPARQAVPEQAPVVDELPEPKDYTFFEKPADLVEYVNEEPESTAHTFEFILNENSESDRFDFGEQPADEISGEPELKEDIVEEKVVPAPIKSLVEDNIEKQVSQKETTSAARPTLNDLLANNKNSVSPKLKDEESKLPITDLKGAITLNEKLLYIKDLFNGYNLAYSEAIDLINKMPDLKTADHFLKNNYAEKNNWQVKQGTVDQFYELLAQRFPNG